MIHEIDEKHNNDLEKKYEIHTAHPSDVAGIENMRYQSWLDTYINEEYGVTKEQIDERFREKLSDEGLAKKAKKIANNLVNDNVMNLVAKDLDGDIIGELYATRGNDNRICGLYTAREFHGSGLGGDLIERALKWIGKNKEIILDVACYNERAKAFYRKHGFVEVGDPYIQDIPNMPQQDMIRRKDEI